MTTNQHVINNIVIYLHRRDDNHHIAEFDISMNMNQILKNIWPKGMYFFHGLSAKDVQKEIFHQLSNISYQANNSNQKTINLILDILKKIIDCSEKNPDCFWHVY